MLAVGARFGDRHTGDLETYRRDRKFIHVDIVLRVCVVLIGFGVAVYLVLE